MQRISISCNVALGEPNRQDTLSLTSPGKRRHPVLIRVLRERADKTDEILSRLTAHLQRSLPLNRNQPKQFQSSRLTGSHTPRRRRIPSSIRQQGENITFPVEGVDGGSISMLSVYVGSGDPYRSQAVYYETAKRQSSRSAKKVRVGIDWPLDLIFSKDIVRLPTLRSISMSEVEEQTIPIVHDYRRPPVEQARIRLPGAA